MEEDYCYGKKRRRRISPHPTRPWKSPRTASEGVGRRNHHSASGTAAKFL
jgi:hypothetical protein